ncbi:hypothetical protein [Marinobacter alexandrii]|uniref:hypothetical protein n=1 Tax=Marinobacter alexandrii TaxID=2570351 RepID=UPI001108BDF9|nr:hypothetical protein [Marinobacter alexandrii]
MQKFKETSTVGIKGKICRKEDPDSLPAPGYLFIVFWEDKQIGVAATFEEAKSIVHAHRLKLKAARDYSTTPSPKF